MNQCKTFYWKQKAYVEQMKYASIHHEECVLKFVGWESAFKTHLNHLNNKHGEGFATPV